MSNKLIRNDPEQDVAMLAQKFVDNLRRPFDIETRKFQISTSLGFSIYPDDTEDAETLIKYADSAMYRAKRQGGNCYQRYKPNAEEITKPNDK